MWSGRKRSQIISQWSAETPNTPGTHTITWDANCPGWTLTYTSYVEGQAIGLAPDMPINPGYVSIGWHTFSGGGFLPYDPEWIPLDPYTDYTFTTEWQMDFGF